jgi:hypothetical protein
MDAELAEDQADADGLFEDWQRQHETKAGSQRALRFGAKPGAPLSRGSLMFYACMISTMPNPHGADGRDQPRVSAGSLGRIV